MSLYAVPNGILPSGFVRGSESGIHFHNVCTYVMVTLRNVISLGMLQVSSMACRFLAGRSNLICRKVGVRFSLMDERVVASVLSELEQLPTSIEA